MNKIILCGRLTRDPEIRVANNNMTIASYYLAVDDPYQKADSDKKTDFFKCTAFGKSAEFAEKYLKKGMKILIEGRVKTGRYKNSEGQEMPSFDVVIERHEFVEKRGDARTSENTNSSNSKPTQRNNDFVNVPEGIEEELPFN